MLNTSFPIQVVNMLAEGGVTIKPKFPSPLRHASCDWTKENYGVTLISSRAQHRGEGCKVIKMHEA